MLNIGLVTDSERRFLNRYLELYNNNKKEYKKIGKYTYLVNKEEPLPYWRQEYAKQG